MLTSHFGCSGLKLKSLRFPNFDATPLETVLKPLENFKRSFLAVNYV